MLEDLIEDLYDIEPVRVSRLGSQIMIMAASGDDAAEIWANRERLTNIQLLAEISEIVVFAGYRRYASGEFRELRANQQHTLRAIQKILYGNRYA